MPVPLTCPSCKTHYKLPDHMAAARPLRVRCFRCRLVFEVESGGGLRPPPDNLPRAPHRATPEASRGPRESGSAKPSPPPEVPPKPAGPSTLTPDARVPPNGAGPREYDLGPLPAGVDADLGPELGEGAPGGWGGAVGGGRGARRPGGPVLGDLAPRTERPFRRTRSPAETGRRAFFTGLLGIVGIAAAGAAAWRAWQGRDWVAFLTGQPYEVQVTARRALQGRAGPLYVVDGSVRNLTGSPKGFFEVRGRLLDADGRPLAERTALAGQVLGDAELKGLSRAELERRIVETRFGRGMSNARVEPRRRVPFQIVFLSAPAAGRIADVRIEVVGAIDVP
jgi:predicted Zn finger-like uncharacterized protein